MKNHSTSIISDAEDSKTTRKIQLNLQGTGQIILINLEQVLQIQNVDFFYQKYLSRTKNNSNFIQISFFEFERDLIKCIHLYANFLWKIDRSDEEQKMKKTIYSVYQEIINEAVWIWNAKIANKF